MKIDQNNITAVALKNYSNSAPWPDNDPWHHYTRASEKHTIEQWLAHDQFAEYKILNAGSGGTEYNIPAKDIIHLDIVKEHIDSFEQYIVSSVEQIPLPGTSVDGIICVGSVLNYADAQRSISEFSRILKCGGFLILEFERSESAEFLWTGKHGKDIFAKQYHYNGQEHLLWLYSERHIIAMLRHYGFRIEKIVRFHTLSSLLNRLGMSEEKAALYAKFDRSLNALSFPLAHNVMLFMTNNISAKGNDRNYTCKNR